MIEASTQFMVGRLSTESGKCNSFNLDGIFGNDSYLQLGVLVRTMATQRSGLADQVCVLTMLLTVASFRTGGSISRN